MEIAHDTIKDLVLKSWVEDGRMYCKFKCKDSARVIGSSAQIKKDLGARGKVVDIVRDNVLQELKKAISHQLYRLIGGAAGNAATQVANTVLDSGAKTIAFTPGERQAAIVDAFQAVRDYFYFDRGLDQWVIMEEMQEYEQWLVRHPIRGEYDNKILARLLFGLVSSDGPATHEEDAFMRSMLPDFDMLVSRGSEPVTQVQLEETENDSRESIYLVACTVAMINRDLSDAEAATLEAAGTGLGIGEASRQELMGMAQRYIIERAAMQGNPSTSDIQALADHIRMERAEAERALVRWKKRMSHAYV